MSKMLNGLKGPAGLRGSGKAVWRHAGAQP